MNTNRTHHLHPATRVDFAAWLSENWRYRELFFFFIWRDIAVKYKQTFLGIAWAFLQPLATMIVFTLLFGKAAKLPSDGIPHPIFYYSGVLPWTFFAAALASSGNCLVSNVNLLTKVYFPRSALPVSAVLAGLLDYIIASMFLLVLMFYYGVGSWHVVFLPLLMLPIVAAALGAGMFLAALNVKYHDIKYTLPFLTQLWLFCTPVIYPLSMVPSQYRFWMGLNPLAGPIEAQRAAVLGRPIDWSMLWISVVVATVLMVSGYIFFTRSERDFADLI